ncbi:MAG: hypothetical protein K5894_14175 [Lachnospiraceae bacterium]|nr:hypothetical protein [Lachnospiraceae bacterium]
MNKDPIISKKYIPVICAIAVLLLIAVISMAVISNNRKDNSVKTEYLG